MSEYNIFLPLLCVLLEKNDNLLYPIIQIWYKNRHNLYFGQSDPSKSDVCLKFKQQKSHERFKTREQKRGKFMKDKNAFLENGLCLNNNYNNIICCFFLL